MPSNLKAWREQRGEWVTLPSGLDVRMVSVNVLDLAMDGDIPAPLSGLVNELLDGKDVDVGGVEDFEKMGPLMNQIAKRAIIDPPVADEPSETHLGVGELTAMDKFFIFERVNDITGVSGLASFRQTENEPVDDAQSGEHIRNEAVDNPGDS